MAVEFHTSVIPDVSVDDASSPINIDFTRNTRNLSLGVFGQQLQAQATPVSAQPRHSNGLGSFDKAGLVKSRSLLAKWKKFWLYDSHRALTQTRDASG